MPGILHEMLSRTPEMVDRGINSFWQARQRRDAEEQEKRRYDLEMQKFDRTSAYNQAVLAFKREHMGQVEVPNAQARVTGAQAEAQNANTNAARLLREPQLLATKAAVTRAEQARRGLDPMAIGSFELSPEFQPSGDLLLDLQRQAEAEAAAAAEAQRASDARKVKLTGDAAQARGNASVNVHRRKAEYDAAHPSKTALERNAWLIAQRENYHALLARAKTARDQWKKAVADTQGRYDPKVFATEAVKAEEELQKSWWFKYGQRLSQNGPIGETDPTGQVELTPVQPGVVPPGQPTPDAEDAFIERVLQRNQR